MLFIQKIEFLLRKFEFFWKNPEYWEKDTHLRNWKTKDSFLFHFSKDYFQYKCIFKSFNHNVIFFNDYSVIRKKNKIISTQINHHYFHFKPTKKLSLMPSSPAQRMRQIDDMKQSFPSQLFSFDWSDQNTSKNWKNASISQKEHE